MQKRLLQTNIFGLLCLVIFCLLIPPPLFAHGDAGTINLLDDQYDPPTATIYKGEKLLFKNASSQSRWPDFSFQSSPKHGPDHFSPNQPLTPGQTWLFNFQYAGTWSYIDKKNPNIHGTFHVIVGKGYSHVQAPDESHSLMNWWDRFVSFV